MEKATFGAGCFWGVEAAFRRIGGVTGTAVGYAGGTTENPTYEQVCRGQTGHAEVVHLTFDPGQVGYDELLKVFWSIHDPTTPDRQGPDVGTQYRSVIFWHNEDQKAATEVSRASKENGGAFGRPIVTEILPAPAFHIAEDYHQQYLDKRRAGSFRPHSSLFGGR